MRPSQIFSPVPSSSQQATENDQYGHYRNGELDLAQQHLHSIPAQYRFCESQVFSPLLVTQIDISHNNFMQLEGIAEFPNLQTLDVSHNGLTSFPDEICSLRHLVSLVARNNLLEDLPKSLDRLPALEALYISGNRFEAIPSVCFTLLNLRILHIGGNRIEYLPNNMGSLNSLEILYLGGNQLREIPASIGRLRKLTALALSDNLLETIPTTLGDLQSLETLAIHNNNIRTLPTEIVKLQNLQQLSLRNNPLVHQFVHDMALDPPSLKEIAGRYVRMAMKDISFKNVLPRELVCYLNSANQCVNPKCQGVYFEACVEHVKFVDFCGKYRVPLLQFLCSTKCSWDSQNYNSSDSSSSSSSDSEEENVPSSSQMKMRKILLG